MKVPIGDFRFNSDMMSALSSIIASERITEDYQTENFERNWSNYINTIYSISANSGTSALELAIKSFEIKNKLIKFDTILTSPLSFVAPTNAILNNTFTSHFVDIEEDGFCIDLELAKKEIEINSTIKGIIPVHLFGYPVKNIDKLKSFTRKHNVFLLEDCAEALGSKYKGQKLGTFGDASIFSFYISHQIQTCELGCICTDDEEIKNLSQSIKNHGLSLQKYPKFNHENVGHNFKTNEFSTGIANTQIKDLDKTIKKRQHIVKRFNECLEKIEHITTPKLDKDVSYLGYPLICNDNIKREKIMNKLTELGIENRPIFGCLPTQQKAFKSMKTKYKGKLPNAERIGKQGFYIGCHQYINEEQIDYVIKCFKRLKWEH